MFLLGVILFLIGAAIGGMIAWVAGIENYKTRLKLRFAADNLPKTLNEWNRALENV